MKKLLSALIVLFFLFSPTLIFARTIQMPVLYDTYLTSKGGVNASYGNQNQMIAGYDLQNDNKASVYIQLEFRGVIPEGSTINSAIVRLHQSGTNGLTPVTLTAHVITSNWNSNVTWNTKPTIGGAIAAVSTTNMQANIDWLITDTFKAWLSGALPNYGLYITYDGRALNQSYQRSFDSLENRINQPLLIVDYTPPAAAQNNPINVANPLITIKPIITMVPIANFPAVDLTISDVKSENVTATTAKIIWKTNKNSTSWVAFGIATDGDLFNVLAGQNDSVKDHSASLSNLYPNKKYSYKVFSKDASGKQVFGPISYFTTAENAQVIVEATPTPTVVDFNPISNLQEKIENKVVESEINKAIENSNSNANETSGSESAVSNQTELKSAGALSGITDKVGIAKLAGILLILLGLMSIVGLMLLYFLGRKAHHHIRKHFKKKHK